MEVNTKDGGIGIRLAALPSPLPAVFSALPLTSTCVALPGARKMPTVLSAVASISSGDSKGLSSSAQDGRMPVRVPAVELSMEFVTEMGKSKMV